MGGGVDSRLGSYIHHPDGESGVIDVEDRSVIITCAVILK